MKIKIYSLLIILLGNLLCRNAWWFQPVQANQVLVLPTQGVAPAIVNVDDTPPVQTKLVLAEMPLEACKSNWTLERSVVQAQTLLNLNQSAECFSLSSRVRHAETVRILSVKPLQISPVIIVVQSGIQLSSEYVGLPVSAQAVINLILVVQLLFLLLIVYWALGLMIGNHFNFFRRFKKVLNLYELMVLRC